MTSTDVHTHASNGTTPMSGSVEMKLEMVVMPVSDADRAKEFYTNLG